MLEPAIIVRQVLVFAHIMFFALAVGAILTEDLRVMTSKRLDTAGLHTTARAIKWLLLGLWLTGVPMVVMSIGSDFALLLDKPKLLTKLLVVTVLTLNGVLLHLVAFPMLRKPTSNPRWSATIASVLGAISTTSWIYASFVGAARYVAPQLSLIDFLGMYAVAIGAAVTIAVLFVRKRLAGMLSQPHNAFAFDDEAPDLASVCNEVENAMGALVQLQARLRSARQGSIAVCETGSPVRPMLVPAKAA
jgi:hypothetical protein